jgi:hypothetical protein
MTQRGTSPIEWPYRLYFAMLAASAGACLGQLALLLLFHARYGGFLVIAGVLLVSRMPRLLLAGRLEALLDGRSGRRTAVRCELAAGSLALGLWACALLLPDPAPAVLVLLLFKGLLAGALKAGSDQLLRHHCSEGDCLKWHDRFRGTPCDSALLAAVAAVILYGQIQLHWLIGIEAASHLASALLLAGSGKPEGVPACPLERAPARAIDWQISGVVVFASACFVTNCLAATLLPLARLNNEFGKLVNLGTLYAITCFTYDPSRRCLARLRTVQGRWLLAASLASTVLLLGVVLLNRFPGNRMTHWLWGLSILVFLLTGFTSGGTWRWIAEQSCQDPSGRPPGRVRALQAFLSTGMLLGTAVILDRFNPLGMGLLLAAGALGGYWLATRRERISCQPPAPALDTIRAQGR